MIDQVELFSRPDSLNRSATNNFFYWKILEKRRRTNSRKGERPFRNDVSVFINKVWLNKEAITRDTHQPNRLVESSQNVQHALCGALQFVLASPWLYWNFFFSPFSFVTGWTIYPERLAGRPAWPVSANELIGYITARSQNTCSTRLGVPKCLLIPFMMVKKGRNWAGVKFNCMHRHIDFQTHK